MAAPGTLQFSCQPGCTKCCEVSGYVYFTEADIRNAARFLGLTKAAFEKQYIYRTAHQRRMRKPKRAGADQTAQCHFLKDGGCSIHPVKPVQCRLFPFWPELVADRKQWRQTTAFCPGIGKGELIQIGAALEMASEMTTAYPGFYWNYPASGSQTGRRSSTNPATGPSPATDAAPPRVSASKPGR